MGQFLQVRQVFVGLDRKNDPVQSCVLLPAVAQLVENGALVG